MKRTLVLVALLLLILSSLAWAEGAPTAGPGPAGGHCVLPDLSRLSPDQAAAAAIQAGLQVSAKSSAAADIPACPATFQCSSIAGCGSSMVCNVTPLGQCCTAGPAVICCSGTIWVERCPCKCVLEDCPRQCGQSTQVTRSCS